MLVSVCVCACLVGLYFSFYFFLCIVPKISLHCFINYLFTLLALFSFYLSFVFFSVSCFILFPRLPELHDLSYFFFQQNLSRLLQLFSLPLYFNSLSFPHLLSAAFHFFSHSLHLLSLLHSLCSDFLFFFY